MRTKTIPSDWLRSEGCRLDVGPYISGALEARVVLEKLSVRKDRLIDLTVGGEGIFHAGREGRVWVDDPKYGVPFSGSTDILKADLSALPLISKKQVARNPRFTIHEGWTLVTRSGSVGRMAYCRPDMDGMACSEHVMRVAPDETKIPAGYLYAYLSSKFGVPLVVSGTYGAIIQHIEPHHIADLPVPRVGASKEAQVHELIVESATKRAKFQEHLVEATNLLLGGASVTDQPPHIWHRSKTTVGFGAKIGRSRTLRASNYRPRVSRLVAKLADQPSVKLGEICSNGYLNTGARFKRIDASREFGVRLVGQKQGFWMFPPGRWISPNHAPKGIYAEDETVMVASSGTLGEHELYCRAILITGRWLEFAYTQHFLRIVSGDERFSGAYLYAFLRSNLAFRIMRAYSTGSKQQEIHLALLSDLPIPLLSENLREKISEKVRHAFLLRDEADLAEENARATIERAIEEAA